MNTDRKRFFNERAEGWMDTWYRDPETGNHTKFDSEFQKLFDLLEIRDGAVVLDVGCGSGVLVPYILRRIGSDGRLFELDYAENMIAVNRRLHSDARVTFMHADVLDMPVDDGSCDLVICFSCLPHLEDKPKAMSRMTRVLKQGGRLAIAHFLSSNEINDCHRKASAVMHDRMPGPEEIGDLFKKADLEMIRFEDRQGFYLALGRKSGAVSGG